ncbi:MAG: TetR/AcrR family transcriptional regulator [Mogibacterium sp.]|nr:TetR/AcrR family transcriptional regulator [Mogibacterium sp.]
MGRPTLSAEAIINNKISIINGAMDMIRENGLQSVSARSLGSRIGMNSALIYRYFKDIDEVVLFACVHVLQEYTREMTLARRDYDASHEEVSDKDIYMLSWELFCKHAFHYPEQYNILFFSKHSSNLNSVIDEYYKLFPHGRNQEDDVILEGMYRTSNLRARNLVLLIPVLEGKKSDREIILINDLTVSFFYALLIQLIGRDQGVTADSQSKRMLEACRYTIET